MNVKANLGDQFREQDLLLVPSEEPTLPEGVVVEEGLVTVPNDRFRYVPVPIANTSKQDIMLTQHTVIGHLQVVKTAYTIQTEQLTTDTAERQPETKQSDTESGRAKNQTNSKMAKSQKPTQWDPPVDLSHLDNAQRQIVGRLLREECHAFAYDGDDIGSILSLKLHITLHDTTPVKKTYMSVPKPLHQEVKEYLQDLLNRGWIIPSRSPYASPIVCVRKKDGTLRLCCDYRELNRKSVPDRHPIPSHESRTCWTLSLAAPGSLS